MILDLLKTFRKSQASSMTLLDLLDQARDAVAEAKERAEAIRHAPLDEATALARVDAWLDATATAAVDRLGLEYSTQPEWTGPSLPMPVFPGDTSPNAKPGLEVLLGLIALTNREHLRDVIAGQIGDRLAGEPGMSDQTRAKRLTQAERDILEAELAEEAIIRQAEASGIAVARRPDASPIALLAAAASLPG
ncbi:hypothetical protein G5B31_20755 [Rhodobacter sp. SGA-6-6]|uniref:hypothetical protein n=1 Tax=Rhodobacter sp. SGA-6-6 TaxID=2710882 RepID=UPI0013EA82EE|nr:hypothetical protein [Rhodobacter sp. SGA-6-6]NGM47951.1 hypothetical protein [Rhodobacter sp. SGA-6-6]